MSQRTSQRTVQRASQRTAQRAAQRAGQRASAPVEPPEATGAWPLALAAVVVAVETVALAASAVGLAIYQAVAQRAHDPLDAWLVVGFAALSAGALAVVWQGLRRRRRWSRAPALLTQLLTIPVGVNALGDGAWWAGVPLLVCGAFGLVGLLAPSTTQALVGDYSSTSKPSRK